MSQRNLSRIGFGVGLVFAATAMAPAQTAPATGPAISQAGSFTVSGSTVLPATSPATITLEGYLAPVDPFEVKLNLKSYAGPFKVKSVVPHGTPVKAGDVLVQFDLTEIDEAIVAATSELEVARAQAAKQAVDNTLAEQNDAQALAVATDAVADAQAAVDWWTRNDAPKFLKQLELQLKNAQDSVDDQKDELDQLQKMYKSEELTNATADIVVKRAVRQFEQSKIMADLTKGDVERRKATEYVDKQQEVERGLFSANQALAALKAQQELSKVERTAATVKAKKALKDAEKKLNELEEDKAALTVKSKIDGVALYGAFDDGSWRGSKSDALKVDEKADVGGPIMTVFTPGRLKASVKVDESKIFAIKSNVAVTVKPAAIESLELTGKTAQLAPLTLGEGGFPLTIELSEVDPRLMPGMKVKVEMGESK